MGLGWGWISEKNISIFLLLPEGGRKYFKNKRTFSPLRSRRMVLTEGVLNDSIKMQLDIAAP